MGDHHPGTYLGSRGRCSNIPELMIESNTITINPYFLTGDQRFNLEVVTETSDGKILGTKYYLQFPEEKPQKKEPPPKPIETDLFMLRSKIADYFGVSVKEMISTYRGGNAVKARQVFCAVARIRMGHKLSAIGDMINRDHSLVTYACRLMNKRDRFPDKRITIQEHYEKIIRLIGS